MPQPTAAAAPLLPAPPPGETRAPTRELRARAAPGSWCPAEGRGGAGAGGGAGLPQNRGQCPGARTRTRTRPACLSRLREAGKRNDRAQTPTPGERRAGPKTPTHPASGVNAAASGRQPHRGLVGPSGPCRRRPLRAGVRASQRGHRCPAAGLWVGWHVPGVTTGQRLRDQSQPPQEIPQPQPGGEGSGVGGALVRGHI